MNDDVCCDDGDVCDGVYCLSPPFALGQSMVFNDLILQLYSVDWAACLYDWWVGWLLGRFCSVIR